MYLTRPTSSLKRSSHLNSYVRYFLTPAKLPHYLYGQDTCEPCVNMKKLKTSSVDKVASSVLVSGFMLE